MMNIAANEPLGAAVIAAIQSGDLDTLERLLIENPGLPASRVNERTLLHLVADWPGHVPNGAAVVKALISAGCDPNAKAPGRFPETPLHWAASSDDVDVLDSLLDGGADIEAPGASIAGATPLDDAVGYGQWRVARRLVERGARVEKLWHAAALGIMLVLEERFGRESKPTSEEVNDAFWQACHGGQREAAEYLLTRGGELNWVPDWAKETPLDIAASAGAHDLAEWLRGQGARSSKATS
jgi:uncharacterized protein